MLWRGCAVLCCCFTWFRMQQCGLVSILPVNAQSHNAKSSSNTIDKGSLLVVVISHNPGSRSVTLDSKVDEGGSKISTSR